MLAAAIRAQLSNPEFRPFVIVLAGGERIEVGHPDSVTLASTEVRGQRVYAVRAGRLTRGSRARCADREHRQRATGADQSELHSYFLRCLKLRHDYEADQLMKQITGKAGKAPEPAWDPLAFAVEEMKRTSQEIAALASQVSALREEVQNQAKTVAALESVSVTLPAAYQAVERRLEAQAGAIRAIHAAVQEREDRFTKLLLTLQPAAAAPAGSDATPEGSPPAVRATACAVPEVTAVAIVLAPDAPWTTETLAGLALIEKSLGTTAVTVRLIVVVCVADVPVPVTVTV